MVASITCQCGKVKIEFSAASPRVSTECCCDHCFARVQCLEARGGPKVSTEQPLLVSKWDDRVKLIKGREYLFAYKMYKPTTKVTNIATSCCHTFLLGQHSEYDAHCVTTSSDFPIFENQENIEPASRWFSNQWDAERLANCRKLVGIWVNEADGTLTGEEGFEDILKAHLASTERPIDEGVTGESFEQIVTSIGTDMIEIISNS